MQFRFEPMDEPSARTIAGWHYEGLYAFYDMDQDAEDRDELLDPHRRADAYFAVFDASDELVGFYCFEQEDTAVVFGLGLRPDCTGRCIGKAFLEAGLAFAVEKFHPTEFRLSVAVFNQRAIRLYQKLGFQSNGIFLNETNGGRYEFLRMIRTATKESNK